MAGRTHPGDTEVRRRISFDAGSSILEHQPRRLFPYLEDAGEMSSLRPDDHSIVPLRLLVLTSISNAVSFPSVCPRDTRGEGARASKTRQDKTQRTKDECPKASVRSRYHAQPLYHYTKAFRPDPAKRLRLGLLCRSRKLREATSGCFFSLLGGVLDYWVSLLRFKRVFYCG